MHNTAVAHWDGRRGRAPRVLLAEPGSKGYGRMARVHTVSHRVRSTPLTPSLYSVYCFPPVSPVSPVYLEIHTSQCAVTTASDIQNSFTAFSAQLRSRLQGLQAALARNIAAALRSRTCYTLEHLTARAISAPSETPSVFAPRPQGAPHRRRGVARSSRSRRS